MGILPQGVHSLHYQATAPSGYCPVFEQDWLTTQLPTVEKDES
jgi:hypothetical protein